MSTGGRGGPHADRARRLLGSVLDHGVHRVHEADLALRHELGEPFPCGAAALLLAATKPPEDEERRRPARERFAELVPQGEIRLMDTKHFVLEDAPEETARAIGEWRP